MIIEEDIPDTDIGYVQRWKRRFEHHLGQALQRSPKQGVSVHVRIVSSTNARLTRYPSLRSLVLLSHVKLCSYEVRPRYRLGTAKESNSGKEKKMFS